MNDVVHFNVNLNKFVKKIGIEAEVAVRKIAFDVLRGVTKKTPVDTGRARANWNLGYQSINTKITSDTTFKLVEPPKGSGNKVIYITNSLPYISALENGSSQKAPKGMVMITLQEIVRSLK